MTSTNDSQVLYCQQGFTLIELMISLVLGLLISAAVMQVFLTSQRVDRIQTAGSEIQDKAVFGLQSIEPQVRLANLGNSGVPLDDKTAMGGIVLTAGNSDDDDNDDNKDEPEDNENQNDNLTKDERKRKRKLEQAADKLEKKAQELDKKAQEKENEAQKKDKEGKTKDAIAKRREAAEKRAEAAEKRKEAAQKRAEAAQIGQNKSSTANSNKSGLSSSNSSQEKPITSTGLFNIKVAGGLDSGYLTRSSAMESTGQEAGRWKGLSNTNVKSDQLTIQYTNTTGKILFDCEGKEIEPNERVIMRYFVVEDEIKTKQDRKNLNLNCDAGRIEKYSNEFDLEDFGGSRTGQTIIQNIDQFNIRLGIQRSVVNNGNPSYEYADMTVAEYMALTDKPYITNIKIAILARSTANSPENSAERFTIFGQEQSLKDQTNAPKYLRRVYESNILLRNARIMRVIDSDQAKTNSNS